MDTEARNMVPGSPQYRSRQRAELVRFAVASRCGAGFGCLDDSGALDPDASIDLYVVCRMTHVFSLALLAGEPPADGGPDAPELAALAEHGVRSLVQGPLRDAEFGGWFSSIAPDGSPTPVKEAYGHAFVVLAATSAVAAGIAGSRALLDMALAVERERFWDESAGMVLEEWDRSWTTLEAYRGVNANMHTVEAYLAAGDVTGDRVWHERAGRISERVEAFARGNDWRIPEHLTPTWAPILDYNRDQPAHPFRPYGATVGHGMEWARLLVAVDKTLGDDAPDGLVEAAVALNDRAIADGWAADGTDGFVYTTDWDGTPVVRARMHWVLAEAICTATILHRVTGDERYATDLQRWWDYADRHLVDHERGSWHHELDSSNQPASGTWSGKPDVYHAYQASLIADVVSFSSFATALVQQGPLAE